jgi:hypothetical protein
VVDEVRKQFFFEKKNQKTFVYRVTRVSTFVFNESKVFCFFFSKKEGLASIPSPDRLFLRVA